MLPLLLALSPPALPVPADSLAVVQVRGFGRVRDRLDGLLTAVAPGFSADRLNDLFRPDGRDLFALDPTARGFVAVLPDGPGLSWAAYLPAGDFDRVCRAALTADERAGLRPGDGYRQTVGWAGPLCLLDRTADGFVIVTPSATVAKRLSGNPPVMAVGQLGTAADTFLDADVGVFVNLPAVARRYGGLLIGTRLTLPHLLASGAFGLPKMAPEQAAQVATVVAAVIQTVNDGTGLAVGLSVGPGGAEVRAAVGLRPGTKSARLLGDPPGLAGPLLDALPAGHTAYSAVALGAGLTAALRDAFPEFRPAAGPRLASWATAGAVAGPTLSVARKLAGEVPSLTRAAFHQNVPLVGRPVLAPAVETVGHLGFDRLTLEYDLPRATAMAADGPVRQAANVVMRTLVGERVSQWTSTDADRLVTATAADWPTARALVAGLLAGDRTPSDPLVTAVRNRLPADAAAVILVDAAAVTARSVGLVRAVAEVLPAVPGLEIPSVVAPPGRSPLAGVAVQTSPTTARLTVVLPADALRAAVATAAGLR
jgi:hypothetical protein